MGFKGVKKGLLEDKPIALSFAPLGLGLLFHVLLVASSILRLLSCIVLSLRHFKLHLSHVVILLFKLGCGHSLRRVSTALVALLWASSVSIPKEYQLLVCLVARAHAASVVEILGEALTLSIKLMLSWLRFYLPFNLRVWVELRNT